MPCIAVAHISLVSHDISTHLNTKMSGRTVIRAGSSLGIHLSYYAKELESPGEKIGSDAMSGTNKFW